MNGIVFNDNSQRIVSFCLGCGDTIYDNDLNGIQCSCGDFYVCVSVADDIVAMAKGYYKPKVVKSKKAYSRKIKHKNKNFDF